MEAALWALPEEVCAYRERVDRLVTAMRDNVYLRCEMLSLGGDVQDLESIAVASYEELMQLKQDF